MPQAEDSAAFKGSPMERAKRRGLARNAAVALGNVGTAEDAEVLTRALEDEEPLVREHVAWAFARLGAPGTRVVAERPGPQRAPTPSDRPERVPAARPHPAPRPLPRAVRRPLDRRGSAAQRSAAQRSAAQRSAAH